MVDAITMDRGIDRVTDGVTNLVTALRHRVTVVMTEAVIRDSTRRRIRYPIVRPVSTSDPVDVIRSCRPQLHAPARLTAKESVRILASRQVRARIGRVISVRCPIISTRRHASTSSAPTRLNRQHSSISLLGSSSSPHNSASSVPAQLNGRVGLIISRVRRLTRDLGRDDNLHP